MQKKKLDKGFFFCSVAESGCLVLMLHSKNISALCLKLDVELEIAGRHPKLASLPGLGKGCCDRGVGGTSLSPAAPRSLPQHPWALGHNHGPCTDTVVEGR